MNKLVDKIQTFLVFNTNLFDEKEDKNERENRAAGNKTTIGNASTDANNKAATTSEEETTSTKSVDESVSKEETHTTSESEETTSKPVDESVSKAESATESKNTSESVEANMHSGTHIKDSQQPGVLDMGFGVKIDTRKMCGYNTVNPTTFQAATCNPNLNRNAYLDYLNQQSAANMQVNVAPPPPTPGMGRHKVDTPKAQNVETKKADEDNVNLNLDKINVETNPPKPPKQWPDSVNQPLPQADPVEKEAAHPVFDNSAVTSRTNCRYLKDIEKLALECGVQIQMIPRPTNNGTDSGLINCLVYTPESDAPNQYKCFTIDTGMIIDRRAKIFPGIVEFGYEDLPAYPVLIKNENDKNGKTKNILNEELFKNIFIGGVKMLEGIKSMYTATFSELNKNVALITMPTQHMNKEIRVSVQDRLIKAMKAGVFEIAQKEAPGSRFMFKPGSYNKKNSSFVLTNVGVPFRFCGPIYQTKPIEIVFSFDENGKPITSYNYPNG